MNASDLVENWLKEQGFKNERDDDGDLRVTDPADALILVGQVDAVVVRHFAQCFQRGPAQIAGILGIAVQYYDFHNNNLLYKIEFHLLKL